MRLTFSAEPIPINIGGYVMYCEKFSAEAEKTFSEQNTVSGSIVFSNIGKKGLIIKLYGRICNEEKPVDFAEYINRLMYGDESIAINYKGSVFNGCMIKSFSAEDKNEGYIYASVTLITAEYPAEEKENEQS